MLCQVGQHLDSAALHLDGDWRRILIEKALIENEFSSVLFLISARLVMRAGDGNRTHIFSLEG